MGPSPSDDDKARVDALRELHLLDTPPEESFDAIAQLASLVCDTPIALLTLLDERRQWFKARVGLTLQETEREQALCNEAVKRPFDVFEVSDASTDPRFDFNPLVAGEPHIRFYAGLKSSARHTAGAGPWKCTATSPWCLAGSMFAPRGELMPIRVATRFSTPTCMRCETATGYLCRIGRRKALRHRVHVRKIRASNPSGPLNGRCPGFDYTPIK